MARKNLNRPVKRRKSAGETGNFQGGQVSTATSSRDRFADRDYKDILMELAGNPTVRYVAAGIATALLTRLANNWADKYPEISKFIRENVDSLEGKFGSLKEGLASTDGQRH